MSSDLTAAIARIRATLPESVADQVCEFVEGQMMPPQFRLLPPELRKHLLKLLPEGIFTHSASPEDPLEKFRRKAPDPALKQISPVRERLLSADPEPERESRHNEARNPVDPANFTPLIIPPILRPDENRLHERVSRLEEAVDRLESADGKD